MNSLKLSRVRELLSVASARRILVVGDVMLDQFIWGRVTRISPEAPVPVVEFEREHFMPGGAANVARNLTALGAQAELFGAVGKDPNATHLRKLLAGAGYEVHEASYGSEVGESTDLFDWLPKFQGEMDKILRVDENDRALPEGKRHQVVLFKSCYPNNRFVSEGTEPGDPNGPALTVANAKATMRGLLPAFAKHPEVLFVYFTAPPNSPNPEKMRLYRFALDTLRGGAMGKAIARQAALARTFNAWVASKNGWLAEYAGKNVVVFDYYDALTDHGKADLSAYPSGDGTDNHPASAGNQKVADEVVPFLNRAVRRAGIGE